MKVFTEITDLLGKKVYRDYRLEKLKERFTPQKAAFISIEFTNQNRDTAQCIVASPDKKLDLVVEDIERAEPLLAKVEDKKVIERVLDILNNEKFLSEELSGEELSSIKEYSFITAKPLVFWEDKELNLLLEEIFEKTSSLFFFTVNKNEARAWLIKKGADIVTAASKIHTDLAKGFIRAEVYNIKDLANFKNLEEAKSRGILKIVDKTYLVEDGDVINIKFNVHR